MNPEKPRQNLKYNKGFTLIEVLIALLIISIGLLAIIKAQHQTLTSTLYLKEKIYSHWIAQNQLALIQQNLVVAPVQQNPIELYNFRFFYSATLEPTNDNHVDKIILTVFDSQKAKLTQLTGFKLKNT